MSGDATSFFEQRYRDAAAGRTDIPWDREEPNDLLVAWLGDRPARGRAVVVGCGLGDDAVLLAARGWTTTAFDAAPTGLAGARARHPAAPVRWEQADLLAPPPAWAGAFDLVVEAYTVQSLPPGLHRPAIGAIGALVAPGGTLFVVASAADMPPGDGPPWPLLREEVEAFAAGDLAFTALDRLPDGRHWRAELRRG